jgi:hypothetical protein
VISGCGFRTADWQTPDTQLHTSPGKAFLDFWNALAKHDSMFQKSPSLAPPVRLRLKKQGIFARLVFQKPVNLRLMAKVPKNPLRPPHGTAQR